MGRHRVPPMPNRLALTDRTTGNVRVLGHSGSPGGLSVDLVAVNANWPDVVQYGTHGGPYNQDYRLYLDNGTLAFEFASGYANQRILTRNGFDNIVLEITVDPGDGSVVYTEYAL